MNSTNIVTGGLKLSQNFLKIDSDAIRTAINAYGKAFSVSNVDTKTNYIVYGVELTQVGLDVLQSAGVVYINDEIFEVDSTTFLAKTVTEIESYNFFLNTFNLNRSTFKEGAKTVAVYRKAFLLESSNSVYTKLDTDTYSTFLTLTERISLPDASTIQKGKVQLADINDVNAGLNTTKAVTPQLLVDRVPFKTIKYDFTGWNMDATQDFLIVTAGITINKIVNVVAVIKWGEIFLPLNSASDNGILNGSVTGWIVGINLKRTSGGSFDNPDFNNASGYLLIDYITN